MIAKFTTDIPQLSNWGEPLLLGPGLHSRRPHALRKARQKGTARSGRTIHQSGAVSCWLEMPLSAIVLSEQPYLQGELMSTSIYDIPVRKISGEDASLAEFKGKVLLVVNVASKCGLTPQYEGLESSTSSITGQGLVVAGFPANNFKSQEPGTERGDPDLLHRQLRREVSHVQQDQCRRPGQASALRGTHCGAAQSRQSQRSSVCAEAATATASRPMPSPRSSGTSRSFSSAAPAKWSSALRPIPLRMRLSWWQPLRRNSPKINWSAAMSRCTGSEYCGLGIDRNATRDARLCDCEAGNPRMQSWDCRADSAFRWSERSHRCIQWQKKPKHGARTRLCCGP